MIAHGRDNRIRWVSPFGNRRVNACSQLTDAYRSVPRHSSPVHAKTSTNCPYLTLESPHHQRQHWIGSKTDTKLGRAVLRGLLVRIINLSLYVRAPILEPDPKIRCKNQRRHGIDLKNPFTMSKRGANPSGPRRRADAKIWSSSLETGGAYRDRTDDLKLAKLALSQLS